MNKKLTVLSSAICGLILSSGLTLSNVQAAQLKQNNNGRISINAIIPSQGYSYYSKISADAHKQIQKYIQQNGESSTADGIRSILINNGISKTVANNISFSLLDLADKSAGYSDFVYPEIKNWAIEVLTDGNGKYSIIDDIGSTQAFKIYAILNHQDIVKLQESCSNMPSGDMRQYYINEMINKGIVDDQTVAKNIAESIWDYGEANWSGLAKSNDNLLILESEDGSTFVPTREVR